MWDEIVEFYSRFIFNSSRIIDWFVYVISIAIIFFGYKIIANKKFYVKNALILLAHIVAIFLALFLLSGVVYIIFKELICVNYIPKLLITVLYVIFFNRYKWQSKVILGATLYTLNYCLIEFAGSLSGVISGMYITELGPPTEILRGFINSWTLIAAIVFRFFCVDRFRDIPISSVVEVLAYSAISVFLTVLRSAFVPYLSAFEKTENYEYSLYPQLYIMITLICVIVFVFACYFFVMRNLRIQQENIELSKKTLHLENTKAMVTLNENNLKQMSKIKHEITNRYSIMRVMLKNKQYEKLDQYFDEISKESVMPLSQVNTGNLSFDMFFNLEISKAVARKIEVNTKLIVPSELSVSEMDMGSLITNLMDNAIEACEKIQGKPRVIDVNVQVVHSYLVLRVSNTIAEETVNSALLLETQKPNKELHGLGTKIIDAIVKKYNGHILRRIEKNTFFVDVMLEIRGAQI